MNRDKVVGMLLGVAIGDKFGQPVECKTGKQIEEKYGWLDKYLPDSHTTDDWQLTLAVAEGLIESGLNMKIQAKKHVEAFKETTNGWGGTTRNAVRDLAKGCSWDKSGQNGEGRGVGNGVAMKLAPVAPFIVRIIKDVNLSEEQRRKKLLEAFSFVRDLTIMTHNTEMAIAASFAHTIALVYSLMDKTDDLAKKIIHGAAQGVKYARASGLQPDEDNIVERFEKLENYSEDPKDFGKLSCYCYDSVPGSHAFFLKNPRSIETLYDVVNAGGDTDSTGSMVGALLGALNGTAIFPTHLVEGLDKKDEILAVAEKLCGKIGL